MSLEAPHGSARRRARERALQALFQADLDGDVPFQVYWEAFGDEDHASREQAEALVRSVEHQRARIDGLIEQCSANWRIERMARVDRNILRLAAGEMLSADAPKAVVINEAIEIAKRYGGEGSPAFVNGILDRLATKIGL